MLNQPALVDTAQVLPGSTRLGVDLTGINESYVGLIQTISGQRKAYIKVLPGRELVNELLGAVVGRALGLPIPRPYLCRATAADLPTSALLSTVGVALVFGSEALPHPDLSRKLLKNNAIVDSWMQSKWGARDEALIFDEWIANVDRNWGNLLVGSDGKVWLIDHGFAFTGRNWVASDLVPTHTFLNKLASTLIPSLTLPQRADLVTAANEYAMHWRTLSASECVTAARLTSLLPQTDVQALQYFLAARVSRLNELIADRVGLPMLGGHQ